MIAIIVLGIGIGISSCQGYRRGVKFYSGDKNTEILGEQVDLLQSKKAEYQFQLRRLERNRLRQLSELQSNEVQQINLLEGEIKRLENQIKELYSQELSEADRLSEQASLEEKILEKEAKLEQLYQSAYSKDLRDIDDQIGQIRSLLLDLEITEDLMLIRTAYNPEKEFFSGNIRNGYEAANSYLLMKWAAQEGSKSNEEFSTQLQALIINEWTRGVTAVIRHSSGLALPDVPLDPKSMTVINLPFPGQYICYFKRGQQRGGTVIKTVNPHLLVNIDGIITDGRIEEKEFAFVLIQRSW